MPGKNTEFAQKQLALFAGALISWRERQVPVKSRAELADLAKISPQNLTNIEERRNFPSFESYTALCRAIGVQPLPVFPAS